MTKLALILITVALAGCSSFEYSSPDGTTFKRSSIGNKLNVKEFEMSSDANGARMIKLKSLSNDQVEFATAVTQAAVQAAISGQTGGVMPAPLAPPSAARATLEPAPVLMTPEVKKAIGEILNPPPVPKSNSAP